MAKRKRTSIAEQIETVSKKPILEKVMDLIPTGSTLLNLACSNVVDAGFLSGSIVNIIGDSCAGKSFLCLTTLAEAVLHPKLDDYELVYNDAEARNHFDMEYLFGKRVTKRIKFCKSKTVTEFRMDINDLLNGDKPFIYVLDSLDAICSDEEKEKFDKKTEAIKKGNRIPGSYKMAKPKDMSELLRNITRDISDKKSLLIIVSQTRAKIGLGFAASTRSGGKALKFYSDHEIWLAVEKTLTKTVNGIKMPIGVSTKIKVTKSINGRSRKTNMLIYYDLGIDDIGSNIDFLVVNKKENLLVTKLKLSDGSSKQKLIADIEEHGLESKLAELVGEVWFDIEEQLKTGRKRRYE